MAGALVVSGLPLLQPWLPAAPRPAPAVGQAATVPGQIAVDAKDGVTPAEIQALAARCGLTLAENSPAPGGADLLAGTVAPGQEAAVLAKLRKDPLVEAAEPMFRYAASGVPNDPLYSRQWNFRSVGAEQAWARGATGKGVTVAVIDTGVAFENDAKCRQARDFSGTRFTAGYDFVDDDAHPNDDNGHGTHVAGTIAETTNNGEGAAGLAYEATIMPLKVLDSFGSGTSADIADAIRYAADHGAQIINMSLGSPMPDQVTRKACQYAAKKGVLIVCAAGNSQGGSVGYPAAFPECLAVSAVDASGGLSWYSSIGKEVDLAAPGGDTREGDDGGILQNTVDFDSGEWEDGYFAFQGTSMASPHVAAVAALAMSRGVTDPAEVRQLLLRGAQAKKPAEKYGAGVLSAARTVQLADAARRDSLLRLLFTLVAGVLGLGVGAIRDRARGLTRFPFAPLGLVLGLLGPDLIFGWLGFGTPVNILLHSALIPLYLLWEAESQRVYRFVTALAIGTFLHLAWDAALGHVPFPDVIPAHALPWLWVNVVVALGVALVAWRRSFAEG